MSDLFSSYESDFQLAIQDAKSKLSSVSAVSEAEHATDECLELLDQMNLEVQNLPSNQKSQYNTKVRSYKTQVNECKTKLKQLLDDQDKYELFGNRYTDSGDGDDIHDDQRKSLLSNNASLERSSERLRDSQRIALETESIGGNILNDLRAQREQISGARNTLLTAEGYVDKSIQTLKSMSRRLTANKFISYAIIAVLIILIFLVLASKFW
ncbi:t-SNARE VTI1 [Yamadazyma tenuis]|uniref:t-SNARE VTI1 n=1 Tax=Candida tenuis TaxID=2315449 RepID=UPI00279E0386|nr:t-SNARE VTI1 [Yamadazyma tenuis]